MNSLERVRLAATGRPGDRVPVGPYLANWTARRVENLEALIQVGKAHRYEVAGQTPEGA